MQLSKKLDILLLFILFLESILNLQHFQKKMNFIVDRLYKDRRVVHRVTTSANEWYNEWQRMATSDNEWQRVVQRVTTSDHFAYFFFFFQIRKEPTTKHPKENSLNLDKDFWRATIELRAETSP